MNIYAVSGQLEVVLSCSWHLFGFQIRFLWLLFSELQLWCFSGFPPESYVSMLWLILWLVGRWIQLEPDSAALLAWRKKWIIFLQNSGYSLGFVPWVWFCCQRDDNLFSWLLHWILIVWISVCVWYWISDVFTVIFRCCFNCCSINFSRQFHQPICKSHLEFVIVQINLELCGPTYRRVLQACIGDNACWPFLLSNKKNY